MKRESTMTAVTGRARDGGIAVRRVKTRPEAAPRGPAHQPAPPREDRPALASVKAWTHTLVLTGELNHRSAHLLESEIEQLCDEGVTGVRLDLRGLASIDPIGVAVIAFRHKLCARRGYEFTLIRGQRSVQQVFEQAGLAELLPFEEHEVFAESRLPAVPVIAQGARGSGEQP